MRICIGLALTLWRAVTAVVAGETRVTEAGEDRVTEDGETRETE